MTHTAPSPALRVSAAKLPTTLVHHPLKLSLRAVRVVLTVLLLAIWSKPTASAQSVTYAGSGAVSFGSLNVCPAGKTAPAPCSKTLTLTYDVIASGTLGTPLALTTGAPNLDYKLAGGSSCTGSVGKGSTCTVNVAFTPTVPGVRSGAVEIVDTSGDVLATTYMYGSGVGPLIGFAPPTALTLASGFNTPLDEPWEIAVDGSGNVFVGDATNIKEFMAVDGSIPPNPAVKVITGGGGIIALDGAGNLFSGGDRNGMVEIFAAGGYAKTRLIGSGIVMPGPIAVDMSGNVFVIDNGPLDGTPSVKEILAAGDYTTTKTLGGGFQFGRYDYLTGLALDSGGDLFVTDPYAYRDLCIHEFVAAGGYTTVREINNGASVIAVDSTGNLLVDSTAGFAVLLAVDGVVPENPVVQLIPNTPELAAGASTGIAFDGHRNLYIAYYNPPNRYLGNFIQVQELQISMPPTVSFEQSVLGQISSDSPQSVQILNQGNAPLELTDISLDSSNWDLVKGSGTPEDCTANTTLISSSLCNINISFKPRETGPLTGTVAVTDNSLNASGSQQSIPLEGIGDAFPPPQITSLNWTYGAPYSVVILNGTHFGATQGMSTVTFNGIPTPHYYWAGTKIYVTVPPNATSGNVVVAVGGEVSNAIYFTVLPMPVVTGISPTSGPVGSYVTITGQNLADYQNKGTVTLNGTPLRMIGQEQPNTTITVEVPTGAVTGRFHVLVNDTGINTSTFTVTK